MSLCVRRRLLTSLALILAVSVVAAQEPRRLAQPDSIPAELAGALISAGGFGGEPQILVGAFPGWMNARIPVPSSARVLGSAFSGTTTVGVFATPQEPAAAIEQLKPELEKLGWAPPPPIPPYAPAGGGFRDQPTAMMGNVPVTTGLTVLTLCGGDQQTLIVRASRQHGGTQVLYRITPTGTVGTCHPRQLSAGPARPGYPTLYNPTWVEEFPAKGDCQLEGSLFAANTQLRTPMSPEQILDHYAKQMLDSGWRPAPSGIVCTWTKQDSTGAPHALSLVVATSTRDSLCHGVWLQVRGAGRR